MFTLLEGLNRFLSFLNLNTKFRNRLYTLLASLTTGYIGYLALNFFRHAAYKRGIAYLLIFFILLYFLVLNFFYYFLDKSVKWDISSYFEKYVQVEHTEPKESNPATKQGGLFDGKMVIYDELTQDYADMQSFEVTVDYLPEGLERIKQLADFMLTHQLVEISQPEKEKQRLWKKEKQTGKKYLLEEGIEIPSFIVENNQQQLLLSIGLNATERIPVAQLNKIGEIEAEKISENYDVVATSAKIIGGDYLEVGRSASQTGTDPYSIQLKVVCLVKLPV